MKSFILLFLALEAKLMNSGLCVVKYLLREVSKASLGMTEGKRWVTAIVTFNRIALLIMANMEHLQQLILGPRSTKIQEKEKEEKKARMTYWVDDLPLSQPHRNISKLDFHFWTKTSRSERQSTSLPKTWPKNWQVNNTTVIKIRSGLNFGRLRRPGGLIYILNFAFLLIKTRR